MAGGAQCCQVCLGASPECFAKENVSKLRVHPVEAVVERRYRQGVIAGCLCPFGD